MSFPDLTTDRLVLRHWSPEEAAAVVADERRPHWAADFPAPGERMIAGLLTRDPDRPHGHFQVIERETGLTVGGIGLKLPAVDGALEFGYGIVPSRRCRGYTTEAVRALVAFARTLPGVTEVFATVDPANVPSVRVLQKAGLRHTGSVPADEVTLHRYVAG
ncbi:GNAT family N-acetyltransferase [Micromonospora auratinigra]|uniref:GNAT family N-acetyltransferase n=1 Tax=Micromonospora auratinigra TaxID=261654 RepID=UPI0018D33E92|nr:GNAT family N-acetyltransferase [Micromonospora auratinigra]